MIAPVLRYALGRLTDGTTGVNALLASVPRAVGESAPAAVTIRSELFNASRTLGLLSPEMLDAGPLVLVSHVGVSEKRGANAKVTLAFRYAAHQADPDAFARDAWLTLWALERSLVVGGALGNMNAKYVTQDRVDISTSPLIGYASPAPSSVDVFEPALLATYDVIDGWAVGAA